MHFATPKPLPFALFVGTVEVDKCSFYTRGEFIPARLELRSARERFRYAL